MENEIKLLIEKNLPAQVGDVLKKALQKGQDDEAKVKQLNEYNTAKDAMIKDLQNKIVEYNRLDERNKGLEAREIAVTEKEINLKVAELQYQLASERDKTQFSKDVALGLVRNTSYKKSIFDSETQSGYTDSRGIWQQPMPVNKSLEEKKSAE